MNLPDESKRLEVKQLGSLLNLESVNKLSHCILVLQSVDRKHTSVEGHHIAAVTSSNPVWQAIRCKAFINADGMYSVPSCPFLEDLLTRYLKISLKLQDVSDT